MMIIIIEGMILKNKPNFVKIMQIVSALI